MAAIGDGCALEIRATSTLDALPWNSETASAAAFSASRHHSDRVRSSARRRCPTRRAPPQWRGWPRASRAPGRRARLVRRPPQACRLVRQDRAPAGGLPRRRRVNIRCGGTGWTVNGSGPFGSRRAHARPKSPRAHIPGAQVAKRPPLVPSGRWAGAPSPRRVDTSLLLTSSIATSAVAATGAPGPAGRIGRPVHAGAG